VTESVRRDVSVVITTYNRVDLVRRAIDSVLAQTVRPGEIVVVDDGSSDGTIAALARYADRVSCVWQPRAGASAARNRGLREARGHWVAFLDSDDEWEPGRLAALVDFVAGHPHAGYIVTGRRLLAADGARRRRTTSWRRTDGDITSDDLLAGMRCGSGMVKRALALAIGGYDERIAAGEDLDFCLRLSFHTRLAEIARPLLLRRVHGRMLSRDSVATAQGYVLIIEKIERDQPAFAARYARRLRALRAAAHTLMGRAHLAGALPSANGTEQARRCFLQAARLQPLAMVHWKYIVISFVAPRLYRRHKRATARSGETERREVK
jgi:glycosyltransferase involved in cell wall biosynthesis